MLLFGEMKMSEINCHGDEVVYSEVIPGWYLVQLVNIPEGIEPFTVNGFVMGEGDFGLTNCNDPDFVFSMPPLPEPVESDESTSGWSAEEKLFYETLEHYQDRMYGFANTCYALTKACIEAGYNPDIDGHVASWLLPKMYESLQKGKLRTWTKTNGLIIYQPDLPKEPHMLLYRLRDTKSPIEELKYVTTPNWLKQATKEIVYVEYSHWDELTSKHYHAIWSLDYVTWKYELREVGTHVHKYTFNEITL